MRRVRALLSGDSFLLDREDPSHTLPAAPVGSEQRANLSFPIVAVGASAGGLEALSTFFRATPADSGMAFVVIQHLPPDSPSLMPEILGRCTTMPVVRSRTVCGYSRIGSMSSGPASPSPSRVGSCGSEERGHHRPVDDLFRSLALEQKEKAVIVVLSGTGTNGTAGAQAIKAAGGLCVAQHPETDRIAGWLQYHSNSNRSRPGLAANLAYRIPK